LPSRRIPPPAPPDLPPEKAFAVLSKQLESLQKLKGACHIEAEAKEKEWAQLTGNVINRAFSSNSPNRSHFSSARSAGDHRVSLNFGGPVVDNARDQRNYEARIQAYEGVLNSCLAELKLDLPEREIQSVFEPGQEYELYRTVKTILGFAAKEIFIIDPYINTEMFEVYADSIPRTVLFRLLTNSANIPSAVLSLAQKYASGGNFQFRSSSSIHDRVLFADNRVWLCGQSLKDAAKKKPTYIVEHDEALIRRIYEDIWSNATPLI
jgi:hypothetical protein